MQYVMFGAGANSKMVLELLGKNNVKYIVDNDVSKSGTLIEGIKCYHYEEKKEELKNENVIVSVSYKLFDEISQQLMKSGVASLKHFSVIQQRLIKAKIESRTDYIGIYKKAIKWLKENTVINEGIINNTKLKKSYPEVTGYYIPTLIKWGYKDLAIQYAKYLCSIQKEHGSWYDTDDKSPYVFDSAQILKGLIAIRDIYPNVDENIQKGCDWILSNMQPSGRLTTPDMTAWGSDRTCSELIHIYCLSPLKEAGIMLNRKDYIEKADKIWNYYKTNHYDEIMNFNLLSHFYAYLMEALLDIGEVEMAKEAMAKIEKIQTKDGYIPAYNDVNWVCSTGLFQLALVWFRLGEFSCGEKAFEYACKLQNESGGWFGSYIVKENCGETNDYFPNAEISWAVKYFLDALYYQNLALFENQASIFKEKISKQDGRYKIVHDEIKKHQESKESLSVLDVGCGKGNYLKNLIEDLPNNKYFGVDLSLSVMEYLELDSIEKKQGSLTNIQYEDNEFDVVYTCEALEHAVDIESAVTEIARVTKDDGLIIIVDKNKERLGRFEIEKWEQWFFEEELKVELLKYCKNVEIVRNIAYDGINDNLFLAWIGER